jgi:hypothetical protein
MKCKYKKGSLCNDCLKQKRFEKFGYEPYCSFLIDSFTIPELIKAHKEYQPVKYCLQQEPKYLGWVRDIINNEV